MAKEFYAFLMFEGRAEEAMTFYCSIFPQSRIVSITRFTAGMPGEEGKVVHATFELGGRQFMASDSYVKHDFTFTPSISIFVECVDADEQQRAHDALLEGGAALMPLDNYGFSQRFAWIRDRFGVTWQLNLA